MDCMTVKEAGAAWGVSPRMAAVYCEQGRVPGARKKGNLWLIPAEAGKPERLLPKGLAGKAG